jgi:phosphocarrier protein FPr/phosphocarrier protein
MSSLILVAPLEGWSTPLDEVPDPVFAGCLLGEGVAIDPTSATLCAPCDAEVITVPPQRHAITLRATNGAQLLLHVGIDTVALGGEGFESHVAVGSRVKAGEPLLSFDLDLLAQRARSVLTPIIVTDEMPFAIVRRTTGRSVRIGDFLMELVAPRTVAGSKQVGAGQATSTRTARIGVPLEHGLHARPAALLVARLKHLAASVSIGAHGKTANARSAIAIMSLGVQRGDEIVVTADGPDAAEAVTAIQEAVKAAAAERIKEVTTSHETRVVAKSRAVASGAARRNYRGAISAVMASPGLAVGAAFHLRQKEIEVVEAGVGEHIERQRLNTAVSRVREKVQASAAGERGAGREVLLAHLEFLEDPELINAAYAWVSRHKSAAFAWRSAVRANVGVLRALPDVRMAERADDLLDLEAQVLTELENPRDVPGNSERAPSDLPPRAIILADELLPSQFVALDATRVAGICTAGGGPTSHVAILATASNIPMLVAAGSAISDIADGTPLILDADGRMLQVSPPEEQRAKAESVVARNRERRAGERAAAQRECRTADGTRIEVFANVGSVAEAREAVAQGAEGCGLLRTEFLFLDRDTAPDPAAQTLLYSGIVTAFDGRPVTVRTLDSGGDKPLAYMPLPVEENPALGVRGVRVSLLYPDILRDQLRAILKAEPRGRCRILLPMISDPAEVRAVGELLDDARRELGHDASVPLGAMIETPAAAMLADQIAREADFLSIGTNDLTQYALAMDRGNPVLAARLDSLHPAVLRLIAAAADGSRLNCREIAVCGGLASDPAAVPILIGLGIHELSAIPAMIPRLKALIGTLTVADCRALAGRALGLQTAAQVRELVAQTGWLA